MIKELVVLITLVCSGCVAPYYGYSENEWNNLSENKKRATKAEYQQIIDAKKSQQHADLINERKQQIINRGASVH